MSVTMGEGLGTVTFADLQAVVAALVEHPVGSRTEAEVLADWRAIESVRNQLAALEHRCIIEAEQLGLPHAHAATSTAAFVRDLLRISPAEANARCGRGARGRATADADRGEDRARVPARRRRASIGVDLAGALPDRGPHRRATA